MIFRNLPPSKSGPFTSARRKRTPKQCISHCLVAFLLMGTAGAETAVFQNGIADPFSGLTYFGTEDTTLTADYFYPPPGFGDPIFGGTNNSGPGIQLGAGHENAGNRTHRILIRFDLSSMAGRFLSIDRVALRMYAAQGVISRTISAYRVSTANSDWVEGNGPLDSGFGPGDIGSSTWQFKIQGTTPGTGIPWASGELPGPQRGLGTAGVDYFAAPIGTITTPPYPDHFSDFVFNDVSFINDWVSGMNGGVLLRQNDETSDGLFGFPSSESASASFRPELIVTYTPTPEPSVAFSLCSAISIALIARPRHRAT